MLQFHFFIIVIVLTTNIKASRSVNGNNTNTILSPNGKELKITCNANISIQYCSITHPNGTEFIPISSTDKENILPYKYENSRLDEGICIYIFMKSSYEDSGEWTCHMGQSFPPGEELVEKIQVKIGGELAAINPTLQVDLGKSVNLSCTTTGGHLSLKYCKFSTPTGVRFSIDETINSTNAIRQEYYFKTDAFLSRGDCAITIIKITNDHLGKWTCSAMIDEYETEYSDYTILELKPKHTSSASVAGLVIGVMALVVVIGGLGYYVWRHHKYNPMNTQMSSPEPTTGRPSVEEPSVQFDPRPSTSSDTSETQVSFFPDIKKTKYGPSTSTP